MADFLAILLLFLGLCWGEITSETACVPGDRKYCFDNGYCRFDGSVCDCDSPNYWPEDRCSVRRSASETMARLPKNIASIVTAFTHEALVDLYPDCILPGYWRIDGVCVDEDECETGSHTCAPNERCLNSDGSFLCLEEINYCEECHFLSNCTIENYNYTCTCPLGFYGNGRDTCDDLDECEGGVHTCDENSDCVNTEGSFSCTCLEGYVGLGTLCTDIDECLYFNMNTCHEAANCTNEIGSFHCTCNDGYVGDGTHCEDLDECLNGTHACDDPHMSCVNSLGSYECICDVGWRLENMLCLDVDECETGEHDCTGVREKCVNFDGTYGCMVLSPCSEGLHSCGDHSVCIPRGSQYRCACEDGYRHTNRTHCEDIDECDLGMHVCWAASSPSLRRALCVNLDGGYTCDCGGGWEYDAEEVQCVDLDECDSCAHLNETESCYHSLCPVGSCVNTVGSYTCQCPMGYAVGESFCEDIDECSASIHDCDTWTHPLENTTCVNGVGNYTCDCGAGFEISWGLDRTCVDIDECAACDDDPVCEDILCPVGQCSNTVGSYTCVCPSGYYVGEFRCEDVDECSALLHDCDTWTHPLENTTCVNGVGNYTCDCGVGFELDEDWDRTCVDIDECAACNDDSVCEEFLCAIGSCVNTIGSYDCVCPEGFSVGQTACEDIDECSLALHSCATWPHPSGQATCVNGEGNYTCDCGIGFEADLSPHDTSLGTCVDVDECAACEGDVMCEEDLCPGLLCSNTVGSYTCVAPCGDGMSYDGSTCIDINECETFLDLCDPTSTTCVNLEGSWACECLPGFVSLAPGGGEGLALGSGFHLDETLWCADVDECEVGVDTCARGSCVNTVGSFMCSCEGISDCDRFGSKCRRRSFVDMSESEIAALIVAFGKVYETGLIHELSDLHVDEFSQAHSVPLFLPWHRELLIRLEDGLKQVTHDPCFTVPYVDWRLCANDPASCEIFPLFGTEGTEENNWCVTDGPFAPGGAWEGWSANANSFQCIRRRWNRSLQFGSYASYDRVMQEGGYESMRFDLEHTSNLHGMPHTFFGNSVAQMTGRDSPIDPIFWLHHAFVDKVYYDWQLRGNNEMNYGDGTQDYDPYTIPLASFRKTAGDVLHLDSLSYTYVETMQNRLAPRFQQADTTNRLCDTPPSPYRADTILSVSPAASTTLTTHTAGSHPTSPLLPADALEGMPASPLTETDVSNTTIITTNFSDANRRSSGTSNASAGDGYITMDDHLRTYGLTYEERVRVYETWEHERNVWDAVCGEHN